MKKVIKKIVRYWYVLFFPIFLQCTEPSIIGLDVQPVTDQLNVKYVDTFQVNAYTIREDSVRSDRTIYYLLGSINDFVFGKSTASFATQLNLPSSNIIFPQDAVVDSIVLSLVVKGFYGNDKHINPLQIRVYEIDDMLYPDSAYFSFQTLKKKSLIGTKTIIPNLKDSVFIDNSKLPPQVRIPLDNTLAKRFIEDAARGKLSNNETFIEYFKGILVEVVPASIGGSIYYFDLLSTASNVTLYYRTSQQSTKFSFLINDKCARFNMYTHDYSVASADFLYQLANPNQPSEKLYLQSRAGTKINISFPNIKEIINPYPVIINRAELVFKVDVTDITSSIYPVPARLTLVRYREDGTYTFIADHASPFFGGEYNSSKKEFKFNITQHIQSIINERTEDYGIALLISGASTRGDRVVLHGMLSDENKPRLKLTYTIIN